MYQERNATEGVPSEQRHMDVACERFRKHTNDPERFRKNCLASGTTVREATGVGSYCYFGQLKGPTLSDRPLLIGSWYLSAKD